jgi:hypothetical protein
VFFCELLWPENLAGITPEIKSLFGNFVKCLMIPFYPNPGGGQGRLFDESGTRDDSELAGDSIELWWLEQGQNDYPDATELLVFCDGGGSNSSSYYIFKEDRQTLSSRLGMNIRICHYPPYCSKYNPIEHRVFPHVTRACKGVPLETIETAKYYIEKTETTKGLKVIVRMLDKAYATGRKYAQDFKKNMTIKFDDFLPKWNDTAIPDPN